MIYTLSDYFDWKVDTYKFEYYVAGFNVHPGELDDLSLDRFQGIEAKCEHFRDRADELLRFRYFEKAIKYEKISHGHSVKFIYSEKGTNFCKISTLLLSTVHTDKSKVAFSEYMNFNVKKIGRFFFKFCCLLRTSEL